MNMNLDLKNELIKLLVIDNEITKIIKKLIVPEGEEIVTKSYFDERLIQLAKEFDEKLEKQSRSFDEKLEKIRIDLAREFDEKLEKQSRSFDEKLEKQSRSFDEKLEKQYKELILFIEKKTTKLENQIKALGSKWGLNTEVTFRKGMEELLNKFGGNVTKWRRKIKFSGEYGVKIDKKYEIDIVVKNDKRILVEIKSTCLKIHVERFIEVCNMYKELENLKDEDIEKVMICLYIDSDAQQLAEQNGIKIIEEE